MHNFAISSVCDPLIHCRLVASCTFFSAFFFCHLELCLFNSFSSVFESCFYCFIGTFECVFVILNTRINVSFLFLILYQYLLILLALLYGSSCNTIIYATPIRATTRATTTPLKRLQTFDPSTSSLNYNEFS